MSIFIRRNKSKTGTKNKPSENEQIVFEKIIVKATVKS